MENLNFFISCRTGVSKFHDKNITHFLSIGDLLQKKPFTKHFKAPIKKYLRLEFGDTIHIFDSESPKEHHIQQIIDFAEVIKEDLKNGKVNLLVHCFAGISRSTAAAFIILCYLYEAGSEELAIKKIQAVRPQLHPNILMVQMADVMMKRQGKMIRAAKDITDEGWKNIAWTY